MPDRFGPRGVLALFIPLQNANMQPEYESMRPTGVNNQIYRFTLADADNAPQAIADQIAGGLGCWPDLIVVGNSIEMRITPAQLATYKANLETRLGGKSLLLATNATLAALQTLQAQRIGIISPMSDTYSQNVANFYSESGYDVVAHTGLQVGLPENIIKIGYAEALDAFARVNSADVDTLLHVGGALGIAHNIEQLEQEFQKPVISVNVATYWHALRQIGVTDPLTGFGQLAQQ
jgi:maleate isomerase